MAEQTKVDTSSWQAALQEVYDADPLEQQRVLCRLYANKLLPEEIQHSLQRLNYPKHHYVWTFPRQGDFDQTDLNVLQAADLCTQLNEYIKRLESVLYVPDEQNGNP